MGMQLGQAAPPARAALRPAVADVAAIRGGKGARIEPGHVYQDRPAIPRLDGELEAEHGIGLNDIADAIREAMPADEARPIPNLPRHGAPVLVRPRLGQGAFRLAVTDGYERRCA